MNKDDQYRAEQEDFEAWFQREMKTNITRFRNHDPATADDWPYQTGDKASSLIITTAFLSWLERAYRQKH